MHLANLRDDAKIGVISIRLAPEGVYVDGDFMACSPERALEALKEHLGEARSGETSSLYSGARVEVDTLATVVVPATYYDNALAGGYLAVNNMLPEGYVPVHTQWNDVVMVMSAPADVVSWLQERFGPKVEFLSPLVHALDTDDTAAAFHIWLTVGNTYIALWDNELKFAEVLPYTSAADLIYYVSELGAQYGLIRRKLYLGGKFDREFIRKLRRVFPKVVPCG